MMQIQHIMKRYGDRQLLDDVNVTIPQGAKVAVFGANGSGKSTLLRILCGLENSDSGAVQTPGKPQVTYLPQEPNPQPEPTVFQEVYSGHGECFRLEAELSALEALMHEGAAAASEIEAYSEKQSRFQTLGGPKVKAAAEKILRGLGFDKSDFQRDPGEFSGGDRMRIELAKVLLADSDFLILDEPTNHLDIKGYVFIESFLKRYGGTLLLVTHDRHLLDHLPTHILHLDGGQARFDKGCLKDFEARLAEEAEQGQAASDRLQKRIKSVEGLVNRFRAKASKAGLVRSRMKMLAKLYDELAEAADGSQEGGAHLMSALPPPPASGNPVLKIKDLGAGYVKALVSVTDLRIERDMRLGIIGVNGAGKTTLLKTLAGRLPALAGQIETGYQVKMAYMEQDLAGSFDPKKSLLQTLLERCPALTEKEGRSLLGRFLFSGSDVFKETSVLSGGEKSRLALASVFGSGANLILLDEPTNHLDLTSKDALLAICQQFGGTMIIVSHDRDFMDQLASHMLAIGPGGKTALVHGAFADLQRFNEETGFLEWDNDLNSAGGTGDQSQREAKGTQDPGKGSARLSPEERRQIKKELERAEKRSSTLEERLARLTGEKSILETAMAAAGTDAGKLRSLQSEWEKAGADIGQCEAEWLEVQESIEALNDQLQGSDS